MSGARRLALIVAGGTGGHLYPGIALGHELQKRDWDIRFVVRQGDLGREILGRESFTLYALAGQGLPRRFSPQALTFPLRLVQGLFGARRLLRELSPAVVVGMGGYLSFPLLVSAREMGIPTAIHEQNVLPGLTNRLLGRVVTSVAVSFRASHRYFPTAKVWVSGLPVRIDIGTLQPEEGRRRLGLDPDRLTFLVVGGSQGASRLNQEMPSLWRLLSAAGKEFQVIHLSGPRDAARTQAAYKELSIGSVVLPYSHDMPAAYGAATLVICRAGASTVAELLAARRPAIFIPYPFASSNHQLFNAQVMKELGAATIVLEAELTPERLKTAIERLLDVAPPDHRTRRYPDLGEEDPKSAAVRLADGIERLAK